MTTEEIGLSRELALLGTENLVARLEAYEEEARQARAAQAVARLKAEMARGLLLERLGDGEAVQAPSGRFLWRDPSGWLGYAEVNAEALNELGDRLAEDLRPVRTWKTVTVTQLRAAARERRLPPGVRVNSLLNLPPKGAKLRWKTVDGG